MAARQKVIIDCDPGIDDAVALLLAWASAEEIDLMAVTTVAGNVPLANTTANALRLRELAGREATPVFAGCPRPMLRPLVTATVHGESGLDGSGLPRARGAVERGHAVSFLRETIAAAPGEITLVAVGPLTNVACALVERPELAREVRRIVIMGGSAGAGNKTPYAEFNFYVDPHAARVVLESGAEIVLHGLDVAYNARTPLPWIEGVGAQGGAVGRAVAGMLSHYVGGAEQPIFDALAVGWLLWPDLFAVEPCGVDIVTDAVPEAGRSVVTRGVAGSVAMAFDVDSEAFHDRLADRLARYGRGPG